MKKLKQKSQRVLKNNKGQGMVEYILLLVVVVSLVFIFKGKIASIVGSKADEVGNAIGEMQIEK